MWFNNLLTCTLLIFTTNIIVAQNADNLEFSMDKGMCYGSCPEYRLEVYKSRYLIYIGIKNTEKLGVYRKTLSKPEYKEICKAFKKSKFDSFEDNYESQVPDLPSVIITHHKKRKSVTGKLERPQMIHNLEELLTKYADSKGNWKLIEKPGINGQDSGEFRVNEIIVLVAHKLDVEQWVKKYHQYGIVVKKRLSPNNYYWLLSFDSSKIPPKQILITLKNDPEIVSAQFNNVLKQRN